MTLQAALLAAGSWLALRLALRLDARASTVVTAAALGVLLAVRLGWRRGAHRLFATDDGLRLESGDVRRVIPWSAIEALKLSAGEIETDAGPVRVCYARVEVAHGPPLAFSDLSSMGAPQLRAAEDDAPVLDLGDPEFLLGTIAERVDATAFLPADAIGPRPESAPAPFWFASPTNTLRLATAFVALQRLSELLPPPSPRRTLALAGVGAALLSHVALRRAVVRLPEWARSLPAGLVATLAAAAATLGLGPAGFTPWALGAALFACLPVWPLPGVAPARAVGRALARAPDAVVSSLPAASGLVIAWLYAKGMLLLPTALLAGCFEVGESLLAARRSLRLAALPRFSRWDAVTLASLRARLRPLPPMAIQAETRAVDVHELRMARDSGAPPRPLAIALALGLTLAAALLGRAVLHGADVDAAAAIRWVAS